MEDIGLLLFFLVFLGIGVFIIILSVVGILKGNRSKHWPNMSGTVVSVKVNFSAGNTDMPDSLGLDVVYTYTVSGMCYRSECYVDSSDDLYDYLNDAESEDSDRGSTIGRCLSSLLGDHGRDGDLLNNSAGKVVTVFFNPSQPQSSLLDPGIHSESFLGLFVGGGFILGAVAILTST
jgi:hypothetical protein